MHVGQLLIRQFAFNLKFNGDVYLVLLLLPYELCFNLAEKPCIFNLTNSLIVYMVNNCHVQHYSLLVTMTSDPQMT